MGINGLNSHINNIEGSYKTVNIVEEIRRYRRDHNEKPVIVINLWTFTSRYQEKLQDNLLGSRYNQIREHFEDFLIKLRENGAVLVFLMKKSRAREEDFVRVCENHYDTQCEISDVIETLKGTSKIIRHYERLQSPPYFPLNFTTCMVLAQVASKYGKIYGMDTLNQKPCTVHVQILEKHKAMAIIGSDTYYFFYEGRWKIWSHNSLDLENMTIREYNKELILKDLGLTVEQGPLFVALSGGLYSSYENIKKIYHFFKPWNEKTRKNFLSIPRFINKRSFPLTDESLGLIVEEIFGRRDEKIFEEFRITIQTMNTKFEPERDPRFDRNIMETFENEFVSIANLILMNSPIFIPPIDLRKLDLQPISSLANRWIQRTAGILQKNQNVVEQLKLIVKTEQTKPTHELQIDVIFPDFEIPSMTEIVYGESNDRALELLLWICSDLKLSTDIAKTVPDVHLCNFIMLAFFIQKRSMKMFEAKLILKTIDDVDGGKVPVNIEYPEFIDERAIRVNTFYSKLYYILHACLGSIGVKQFKTDFKFDSVWFYENYENFKRAEQDFEPIYDLEKIFVEFRKVVNCESSN